MFPAACGSDGTTKVDAAHGTGGTVAADAATVLSAVPSCAGDGPGLSGTYTVPVATTLARYASFSIEGIDFCATDGVATLGYKFPALLLGAEQHVTFAGALDTRATEIVLSSSQGTARCSAVSGTWTCRETLVGVAPEPKKLDEALVALPPSEASARRQVADAFGTDPIGVLEFSVP